MKIRKIAARSPTPNQRMASGIQARGEMGRRIWLRGLKAISPRRYQPMVRPSGIARMAAKSKPPGDAEERGDDVLQQQSMSDQISDAEHNSPRTREELSGMATDCDLPED